MGPLLQRLGTVILVIAAIVGVVLAVSTAFISGIGWDAPFEVEWGSLVASSTSSPESIAALKASVPTQDLSKGPQLFWLAQGIGLLTPLPTWTSDISVPSNYVLLGLASATLALVGPVLLACAVRMVTEHWLPAVAGFSLLVTTPLWLGMSSIDYRDIQVASGLTACTAGLLIMVMRPHHNRNWLLTAFVFLSLGSLLSVAGRAGAVVLATFLCVWAIVILVLRATGSSTSWREVGVSSVSVVLSLGLGTALATVMHPIGRAEPMSWLTQAVNFASDNPNVMLVRVMGRNISSDQAPLWYVPAWITAQLPLATLSLGIIGVGAWLLRRRKSRRLSVPGDLYLVLLGQALILPLAIVITSPNIYDGIRHFLFVLPPLLNLIVLSVLKIRWEVAVPLIVLSVVLSLFASTRWFPYSYAFVNPVAGAIRDVRVWEYDFWGLSARAGIDQLRELGAQRVFVRPGSRSTVPFGGEEFDTYLKSKDSGETWGGVTFLRWDAELPPECATEFVIKRDGITLLIGGICS